MNREDITRMARDAGFVGMDGEHGALRRFAALVAAAAVEREREACITALRELTLDHKSDDYYRGWLDMRDAAETAIRARKETK